MRRPLPPTATLACARASPRPLFAAPLHSVAAASTARKSRGPQRDRETSSSAATARAGAGSNTSVGRPLPLEGRRLRGRQSSQLPVPRSATSGEFRTPDRWDGLAHTSSAAAPRSTGTGDWKQALCHLLAVMAAARLQLATRTQNGTHPHETGQALLYLVRTVFPHSPDIKIPHEGLSSTPGLSPDPRLRQPL